MTLRVAQVSIHHHLEYVVTLVLSSLSNKEWGSCIITFGKRYLHCAYETGEEAYDEKYHASGLINLASSIRHRKEERKLTDTLNQRRLRIASRVANINDEWNPAIVERGLCVVSRPLKCKNPKNIRGRSQ